MGNIVRSQIREPQRRSMVLRVRADGSASSAARGAHTLDARAPGASWTDDVYRASRRAATLVQAELVRALGFPDRGLQERSDSTGLNWADVPVILVEMGFMTNPSEDRALRDARRARASRARALPRDAPVPRASARPLQGFDQD